MNCTGVAFIFVMLICEQPLPPASTATFCQIYKPNFWDKNDTRETKEQVDTNNRIYKKLCSKK